jgi:hypothetical protein
MLSELLGQRLCVGLYTITQAALLQQSRMDLVMLTLENAPGHRSMAFRTSHLDFP